MFVLLVLAACFCGALSHTCAKVALRNGMATHRFFLVRITAGAVASAILYAALLNPAEPHFFSSPRLFIPALWLGVLVPFGSNVFYFLALRRGDLCVVSPAGHITPLFVALLAWPLLGETPNAAAGVALALIIVGLVMSARGRHATHPHLGAWVVLPVLLATGTALSNSFNYVFQKKLLQEVPKTDVNLVQNLVSLVLFSLYYLWFAKAGTPTAREERLPRRNALLTAVSGILVFALSNLCMFTAVTLAPRVSVVMVLATLGVPLAALFGWVLLRERPTATQLKGGGLIFLGALIAKLWQAVG